MLPTYILISLLLELSSSSPVYNMQPAYITANIGSTGRNIRNLPCISRKTNQSGVCMFAIDCLKSNGTHLGTCIDRFYFGSCCHVAPLVEITENTIDTSIIPAREPPHRITSSTSTTNNVGSTTTEKVVEITSRKPTTTTSTTTVPSITKQPTSKEPLPSSYSISSTTTTQKITSPSTTTESKTSAGVTFDTTIQADVEETTENFKLSTFQSVDGNEVPTTLRPAFVTIGSSTSTSSKPTSIMKPVNTIKPNTTNRPRPIITMKPPTSYRPVLTSSPPQRTTVKPSYRPTRPKPVKPAVTTKPTKVTKVPVKLATKPTKTTTTTTTTTKAPIATTKPPPVTTLTPLTIKVPSTTLELPKPTTNSDKITTASASTISETSTKLDTASVQTTESLITTKVPMQQDDEIKMTVSSSTSTSQATTQTPNEILVNNSNINVTSILEAVNGNPATNEIESDVPPKVAVNGNTTTTTSTVRTSPIAATTESTTKPGFVTWTNEENGTPSGNATQDPDDWMPLTTPDGWVLLPSISTITETNPSTVDNSAVVSSESESSATTTATESDNKLESPATTTTTPAAAAATSSSGDSDGSTTGTTIIDGTIADKTTTNTSTSPETSVSTQEVTTEATGIPPLTPKPPTELPIVDVDGGGSPNGTTSSVNGSTVSVENDAERPVNMSDFTHVCGRRMHPEARIVGGEKSSFGKWPWQISLRQWRTSTYLHKCGAALLNENWAITAAHCVDNVPPSDLLLRLGEHDLSTESEPYLHQERRVQIVASHPQFDPRTFEYDLALLRFYEPVTFQPNIIPVCVPQNDETFVGRTAHVTGWGRLYEDGPLPSVLQEVAVPVINNTVCESMYRAAGYIEHIPYIFICAGWRRGGFDSCEGDSGGPMVIQRADKRFLLAGVISWGIGCAEPNQPGVYTRISEFRDWINQILQF